MKQSTWSVHAKNLPEHSRNAIHTDEGGKAAGFDGALVAGVTVYAYLTNPILTPVSYTHLTLPTILHV